MAAMVDIVSRCGLDAHHRSQPNKNKLVRISHYFHFSCDRFSYKDVCDVCGLRMRIEVLI